MSKSVVVVDNYDSFTYNLVQYLQTLGVNCDVRLNDAITVDEIRDKSPNGILLSPGPGTPNDAGVTLEVIEKLKGEIPLLGVCLGHQSIAQAFGAEVVRASRLMHGKTSPITHQGEGVFFNLPSPITATRYHSLIVKPESVPDCLSVTAKTHEGEIMGLMHKKMPIEGVQFHPESILTDQGLQMVKNWVERL